MSFASEPVELEVFLDQHYVCRAPCVRMLNPGRYYLSFSQNHDDETSGRSEHARHPHDEDHFQHEYGYIDVDRAINLQVHFFDRSDLRLAGDIVLIVGVTIGALLAGTIFASYQGNDDSLLAAGMTGVVLAGLSLGVGIPLSIYDDKVE